MKLFDAHCHLQSPEAFERAVAAGIAGLAICIDFSTVRNPVAPGGFLFSNGWKKRFQSVEEVGKKCALTQSVGIHPWFVSKDWKKDFQALEACFTGQEIEAAMRWLGETGLDFQEKFTNRSEQEKCFAAHLDLARKLDRPIAVHCVKAWGRLVELLQAHPAQRILLHAYSGSAEMIPELLKLNCWFSFGPSVMSPNAKRARASVVAVPADRLLIETDSVDEPEKLIEVARAVAELRDVPVEEIAALTFDNAQTLFFLVID